MQLTYRDFTSKFRQIYQYFYIQLLYILRMILALLVGRSDMISSSEWI